MDKQPNKYINVAYQLYDVTDGEPTLIEQTSDDKPFAFLSGFGITLKDFESAVAGLAQGEEFDFTLTPGQAYGDYEAERVLDLDKEMFVVDGKFDEANIYVDAIVPLQNEDGNRFMGHVLAISDDKVRMDLNHPLAGKTLNFKGHIIENRDATNEELEQFANMLGGEHPCKGGCGNCGDDGECCGNHGEGHCHNHEGGHCSHHEEGHCCHHHDNQ